jgi:hypothetical protein
VTAFRQWPLDVDAARRRLGVPHEDELPGRHGRQVSHGGYPFLASWQDLDVKCLSASGADVAGTGKVDR